MLWKEYSIMIFCLLDFLLWKHLLLTEHPIPESPKTVKGNFDISKNVGVQEETLLLLLDYCFVICWTR